MQTEVGKAKCEVGEPTSLSRRCKQPYPIVDAAFATVESRCFSGRSIRFLDCYKRVGADLPSEAINLSDQSVKSITHCRAAPKLLVSVRDEREVDVIESLSPDLRALVGVIDLKEPRHGSLGKASRETATQVLKLISNKTVCSAALGELVEDDLIQPSQSLPSGFNFAKLGLANANSLTNWQQRWQQQMDGLPTGTASVAVVYLDHQSCNAPTPDAICQLASEYGCQGVLLDTFDKSAGGFADHIGSSDLRKLLQEIHQKQMFSVLAGSIDRHMLPIAMSFSPTMIGVRGAVCELDRSGSLTENSLIQFCQCYYAASEQFAKA